MMDINKYKNDGWGLSKNQLSQIVEIITSVDKKELNVVEFGSGKSTEFLVDIVLNGIKVLKIDSFDNDPEYAYKNTNNYEFLNLMIRELYECTDTEYNKMFENLKLNKDSLYLKKTPLTSRQKNNFYNIKDGDLTGIYDLMILDGPNGNGRNISYLYMIEHLDVGSIVLIDDYTHYDFIEKFSLFFNYEVLYESKTGNVNQWELGGDYKILRIKSKV